jgi:hypothetical protein
MIDFWEILGRAATDDVFRNTMYDSFNGKQPAATANPFACLFADADYDTVRNLVIPRIGPVSLMALGEWLVVSMLHDNTRPLLNNVSQIAQQILTGYQSTNPVFYQALGAGIVDTGFRDAFNLAQEEAFGFRLNAADRNALAPVLADGAFSAQSGQFHDSAWGETCKDMCLQNVGSRYAHALETQFP